MKLKKYTKVLSLLYLFAMLFMLLPLGTTAYAAEAYEPLTLEVPYKHTYTTTDTKADSVFHYIITAQDEAPLPAEVSETGSFSFNGVSGSGHKSGNNTTFDLSDTLTFTFTKPGIYVYEIKADLETDSKKTNADCYTFEDNTIIITICVSDISSDKLELQAFTVEDCEDIKLNEIRFNPIYKAHTTSLSNASHNSYSSKNSDNSKISDSSSDNRKNSDNSKNSSVTKNLNPFKTGNSRHIWRYAAIICASGGIIILLLANISKKGREENE